jgi:hypothetical protein
MISLKMDGIEYRFFDHLFAVSRCGKVLRKLQPYAPRSCRSDGYLTLGRERLMHRVIATCWVDKPEGATQVHHINECKHDNHADNLMWVTPKQHVGELHHGIHGKYVRTEATREKYRQNRLGKKDSEEVRLRKVAILAAVFPRRACIFNGVSYPSVAAGARVAGLHPSSFRLRCLSKNFPNYELS